MFWRPDSLLYDLLNMNVVKKIHALLIIMSCFDFYIIDFYNSFGDAGY